MMKVKELFKRNKLVLKLALPIFFELIFTILIGSVDQYMISSDQTAVNAIIQVNTICNVVVIAFNVLATASMILISQYHGAKDSKEANLIYALSFYINLIIGLVISAFLFFGSDLIFSMMGIDSSVIPDADIYMKYTGAFIFLQGMTTTFSAFLRANKLMVQSTVISLCANIINIAGNAILLYVIPMGIEGIAIASTVSRIIALILVMVVYFRKIGVSLSIRKLFPFNHRLVHNLLKIGLPSAGENFSYNFSQVAILIILNMDGVMAGNIKGYASNIVMLVYIFASGITTAMQVIEGEYLGSGKIKEADQLVKDTTKMSIIVSFCISIILFAISYPLFYLLMQSSSDPKYAAMTGMIVLGIDIVLEIGRAGNIVLVRGLQTSGDINFPVISAIIFCWVVAVGGTFLFGHVLGLGVIGCWIAMMLDECSRCVIFIFRWKGGKWKKISLVSKNEANNIKAIK